MPSNPEVLGTFDPETGEVDERILASFSEEQLNQRIDEAMQVKQMTDTKGWKLIESRLYSIIEGLTQKLVDLDDINEIRKHQATIRSFSNVLGLVQHTIADGEHLSSLKGGESQP